MDHLRRWQIVTAVTAVTGLGLGAMAVGNQPSEQVPAIDLTPTSTSPAPSVVADEPQSGDARTEIVSPQVRSLEPSAASLDTDEAPDERPASPDDTDNTDNTDSADTPVSVHSPDSVDSPDSRDSG